MGRFWERAVNDFGSFVYGLGLLVTAEWNRYCASGW